MPRYTRTTVYQLGLVQKVMLCRQVDTSTVDGLTTANFRPPGSGAVKCRGNVFNAPPPNNDLLFWHRLSGVMSHCSRLQASRPTISSSPRDPVQSDCPREWHRMLIMVLTFLPVSITLRLPSSCDGSPTAHSLVQCYNALSQAHTQTNLHLRNTTLGYGLHFHIEIPERFFYLLFTPWSESASELYQPSDRRLSAK
jgi:hypothetical protein